MAEPNKEPTPLETLLSIARRAELAAFSDAEFWRDAFWLAQFVPPGTGEDRRSKPVETTPRPITATARMPGATTTPPPATTAPPVSQTRAEVTGPGQLYPKLEAGTGGSKASTIYVPASGALPQPLELARALRPFQEKFRSRRLTKLDVNATAELSAERREVTPVLTSEKERWFSLALLVDDAPSMAVWRKTARELARFLGTLGVFRDVRMWFADQDLRLTSGGGRDARSRQLVDPAGRTLIVALTNGVGLHWRSRELAEWLTDWARSGPVAICSLLPSMRWQFTDLGPAYLWARASLPGVSNRLLTAGEGPSRVAMKPGATLFPIFPLTKQGLEEWAAMQMSRRETKTAAVAISPAWFDPWKELEAEPPPARDAARRVAEFRSFASRDAAKLLEYLSALDSLYLPVMRLVQATMLPESPLSAMAEVLMSGLVVPKAASGSKLPPSQSSQADPAQFEFTKDAREYLLHRTSSADRDHIYYEVLGALKEYIERRAGKSVLDFEALVEDPEGLRDLPPDARHFAQVTAEALRSMGYSKRRKAPPPLPVEPPGVYVRWDAPEIEAFSLDLIADLRDRGLRVLEARNQEAPAEGCYLNISNTMDDVPPEFTEALIRIMESGLDGAELRTPGIAPTADTELIFADAYPGRKELLDALVHKLGTFDVVPPPPPKGAPHVAAGTRFDDQVHTEGLFRDGVGILFGNEAFNPQPYMIVFAWFRETRQEYAGGIRWLKNGETPENRPDQLLIYDRPDDVLRIPTGSKAVLLNPEIFAMFELAEDTPVYEGPEAAITPVAARMAEKLQGVLPEDLIGDLSHSPRLLEMATQMTSDEQVWPAIRERFPEEWRLASANASRTVVAMAVRMGVASFEALEPRLLWAAGIAGALLDDVTEVFARRLVAPDAWQQLKDFGLTKGVGYEATGSCRTIARRSRQWRDWNSQILQVAGINRETWLDLMAAEPYLRRHTIVHLMEAGVFWLVEEIVTDFRWWRLRIEQDGIRAVLQDLESLPEKAVDVRDVNAFLKGLWKDSALNASEVAQAIAQYGQPLPEQLRKTAAGTIASSGAPPAHFILLAASRPATVAGVVEDRVLWAAEAIANEIALHNCGLICGAEGGGDATAVNAFIKKRSAMQLPAGPALQIVTQGDEPLHFAVPPGTKVIRSEDQVIDSVRLADTVVLVGGNLFVGKVARFAQEIGKRVFAVPGAGGMAADLFRASWPAPSQPAWAAPIDTSDAAARVADALLDAIKESFNTPRDEAAGSADIQSARAALRNGGASIYVNVVGTGAHQLDTLVQVAAEEIGRALAQAGFGLITGAWPGVDYVAARAYLASGGKSLVHVTGLYSSDRFPEALDIEERSPDWAPRLSDGVVLIGGAGGTMDMFKAARNLEIPVFPYARSGGDAKTAVETLEPEGNGVLRQDLSPAEFAAYVVRKLTGRSTRLWELAARYDAIRETMEPGAARTAQMQAIFNEMLLHAEAEAGELSPLQASGSAGRRLAAIAILNWRPRKEELDWLAERLGSGVEKPFAGYQAALALIEAVRTVGDFEALQAALDKARKLGEKLPSGSDRQRALAVAQRDLFRRRAIQEAPYVARLVEALLAQTGKALHVITRNLPVFRAEGQTWLSFTTAGVACVLDNAVQWFQELESATAGSVVAATLKTGVRAPQSRSSDLLEANHLKEVVSKELRRALDFYERAKAIDLL